MWMKILFEQSSENTRMYFLFFILFSPSSIQNDLHFLQNHQGKKKKKKKKKTEKSRL
jgi:hypothetical protein